LKVAIMLLHLKDGMNSFEVEILTSEETLSCNKASGSGS
jgi:hypothetical protein